MQTGLYHVARARAIPGSHDFRQEPHPLPHPDIVHQAHSPFPDLHARMEWATYVIINLQYGSTPASILRYLCAKIQDHSGCISTVHEIAAAAGAKERTTQDTLARLVRDQVLIPHRAGNQPTRYYLPTRWILDQSSWYPDAEITHPAGQKPAHRTHRSPAESAEPPQQPHAESAESPQNPTTESAEPPQQPHADSAGTPQKPTADSAESPQNPTANPTSVTVTGDEEDTLKLNHPSLRNKKRPGNNHSEHSPRLHNSYKGQNAKSAESHPPQIPPEPRARNDSADFAEQPGPPPTQFNETYVRHALAYYRAAGIQTWNSDEAAVNIYRTDYQRFLNNLAGWQQRHQTAAEPAASKHAQDYAQLRNRRAQA